MDFQLTDLAGLAPGAVLVAETVETRDGARVRYSTALLTVSMEEFQRRGGCFARKSR
ncbi:hypothetical protein ACFOW4_20890 [Micromonospora sp. GCM10011542]|uniref:hypothetical protein n=1 Tax=Micromonospora sp. GCM10011542 TaxID=3317337 RepID=UPI00362384A9